MVFDLIEIAYKRALLCRVLIRFDNETNTIITNIVIIWKPKGIKSAISIQCVSILSANSRYCSHQHDRHMW